jgi:hypothetical protein
MTRTPAAKHPVKHAAAATAVPQTGPAISPADFTRQELVRISKAHRHLRFRPAGDYFFAARATLTNVVALELAQAAVSYPLAFIEDAQPRGGETGVELVALLSTVPERNLFVTPAGAWLSEFVPASINTYPFQYRHAEGPSGPGNAALFVDQRSGLLGPDQGEPLFDAEGKPSETTKEIVRVLRGLEKSRRATRKACARLRDCRLLAPWGSESEVPEFRRLLRLDETALNRLPQGVLSMLRQTGALAIAYAQMLSLAVLPRLAGLARRHAAADAQRQQFLSSCFQDPGSQGDLGGLSGLDSFKF